MGSGITEVGAKSGMEVAFVEISDEKNQFDGFSATLRVTYGGQAALKVHRRN